MALSNAERIGKCLELLNRGLAPFVERELKQNLGKDWLQIVQSSLREYQIAGLSSNVLVWDTQILLQVMISHWRGVFQSTLGHSGRSMVGELVDVRNRWAHQRPFNTADALRSLDTIQRMLAAVSSEHAREVEKHHYEVMRTRFEDQTRQETKKVERAVLEGNPQAGLKPWREVVFPHDDVQTGRFQVAEFAADLWQVYRGEAKGEYGDPIEFFKRTFLTDGLKHLLKIGLERLSKDGGDPVIELQTNFGGGKTHSMLALYHLFGGVDVAKLPGVDALVKDYGIDPPKNVRRAVIVGTQINPGMAHEKPDGTVVRTLWGEIAWQLGGKKEGRKFYKFVEEADKNSTNPGEALQELFKAASPCLIMIDEWVAYARQLRDTSDLPAGSFDTHFTFAQTLSECVKAVPGALLVASLPESNDQEVGGERGSRTLDRLKNALGRLQAPWRPATPEEGFEIVRRRLFIQDNSTAVHRDAVVKAFYEKYQTEHHDFPPECKEPRYRERLTSAYPIHPVLFDFLFEYWSTLERFQRTRGVLRLMATVIHSLWKSNDRNLLILPAFVPVDDPNVQEELQKQLDDRWEGVIGNDIDGPAAFPVRLDAENKTMGRFSACRRVARTIFMGSAPMLRQTANKGISARQIALACFQPGEQVATFGDALRRIHQGSSYLNEESGRYWYSTQATIATKAKELAQQFIEQKDPIIQLINERLKKATSSGASRGEFSRVHAIPAGPGDIPDEQDARLVILGIDHPHAAKNNDSPAIRFAKKVLESKGSSPRVCRNTLIFLAPESEAVNGLVMAGADLLSWQTILDRRNEYDLQQSSVRQAEERKRNAEQTFELRIPEVFLWLIYPTQTSVSAQVDWVEEKLTGTEPLPVRASKKLISGDQLVSALGPGSLRKELDRVPLWTGDSVRLRDLVGYYTQYLYLPRLKSPQVLLEAIEQGCSRTDWNPTLFAYAEEFDQKSGKFLGLAAGQVVRAVVNDTTVLVKPQIAAAQMLATAPGAAATGMSSSFGGASSAAPAQRPSGPVPQPLPRVFYASIPIKDPGRLAKEAGTINTEIISHLTGIFGAEAEINIEVRVTVPEGIPEGVQRIISENCRTLKYTPQFED